jgi:hypothetical protein
MSNTQKKTAPGRISGGGRAGRETSLCARGKQYINTESDASIYLGRELIGVLIDEPRQVAALTPGRFLIGLFPDRKAASHAIHIHHQTAAKAA